MGRSQEGHAALTLYFDRNFGKRLPKALLTLACPFDVRYHDGEKFAPDMPDDEWLQIIGPKGWIVCSHDAKWQKEHSALEAIKQHKIGCFYLYGANSLAFFKVGSLAHNYAKINDKCGRERRPFIYRISDKNRLKRIL